MSIAAGFAGRTLLGALFLVATAMVAQAADQKPAEAPRLAIKGYDPVAYFTEGRPVRGSAELEQVWEGARWRFASTQHRDLFKVDPDRYAPQYGGFCASGVAQGVKFEVDPEAWAIVDGKLYLNYSKDSLKEWKQDPAAKIAHADANWPRVRGQPMQ